MKISHLTQGYEILGSLCGPSTEDNVVEDLDFKHMTGSNKLSCDANVSFTGTRIAARVIMGENDRRCTTDDRRAENVASMDQKGIECALRNGMNRYQPSSRVDQKYAQMLNRLGPEFLSEQVGDPFRRIHKRRIRLGLACESLSEEKCSSNGGGF